MSRATLTVYCIALSSPDQNTTTEWYWRRNVRDSKLEHSTTHTETAFELKVPVESTYDETTELVNFATWTREQALEKV